MLPARTLILTLALSQAQAMACTGDWAWFVAKSTGTNWSTESGKAASVQILGQNITIELNDSEGLRGQVSAFAEHFFDVVVSESQRSLNTCGSPWNRLCARWYSVVLSNGWLFGSRRRSA